MSLSFSPMFAAEVPKGRATQMLGFSQWALAFG
jgi:hypothetical protein